MNRDGFNVYIRKWKHANRCVGLWDSRVQRFNSSKHVNYSLYYTDQCGEKNYLYKKKLKIIIHNEHQKNMDSDMVCGRDSSSLVFR